MKVLKPNIFVLTVITNCLHFPFLIKLLVKKVNSVLQAAQLFFQMAAFKNKGILAGNSRKSQEEHHRTIMAPDKNGIGINAEDIAQVPGNDDRKANKKIAHERSS